MRSFCPLLIGLLLVPPPVGASDADLDWQPILEKYARPDPAEQRRRIGELQARLDRANRLLAAPSRAAAQPAPPAELPTLLRQTDQREKAAIQRLARRFRIRVYDTFRLDRDEYSMRRAAWERTLASWEAAGSDFEEQVRLIDWLEAATVRSTAGSIGPLPASPTFGRSAALGAPPAALPRVAETVEPPPMARPADPVARTSDVQRSHDTPRAEPPARALPLLPPAAVLPHQVPEDQPVSATAAAPRPPAAPIRRRADLPLIAERESAPATIRATPGSIGPVVSAAGMGARRAAGDPPALAGQPISGPPPSDGPVLLPPAAAQRATTSGVPATTPGQTRRPPARTTDRAGARQPRPERSSRDGLPHRVNVAELAAQVAGSNLALQALESELAKGGAWNARRLAPLVERLEMLVIRHGDLALFYGVILPRERSAVGRLDSPQEVIPRLAARIFEARSHASGADFIGTEDQREAELLALNELSRRLAATASQR